MKLFWVRCHESVIMVVNLSKKPKKDMKRWEEGQVPELPGFTWEESNSSKIEVSKL